MPHSVKDLHQKIKTITDGEYASAKQEVDRLRQELGQPPLPSLQSTLEEKSAEYVLSLCLPPSSRSLAPNAHAYPAVSVSSVRAFMRPSGT